MATNILSVNNADTILDSESPNSNFGSSTAIYTAASWGTYRRGLFRFTLPSISLGTITQVTLNLYELGTFSANGIVSQNIHQLTRTDWVEAQATYYNYKTGSAWTAVGGDYNSTIIDTVNTVLAGNWQQFVLQGTGATNPLSLTWGNTINLLIKNAVESTGGWHGSGIASKEYATSSFRPYLEITYTPSGGGTAWTKNLSESVTATDAITKTVRLAKTESATATDNIVTIFSGVYTKTLTESVTATDTISKHFTKILTESVTATDDISKFIVLVKTESATATDDTSKSVGLAKNESVTVQDNATTDKSGALFLSFSESVTVTDDIVTTTDYHLSFDESVTVTDSVNPQRNPFNSNYFVYEDGKFKIIVNGTVVAQYG